MTLLLTYNSDASRMVGTQMTLYFTALKNGKGDLFEVTIVVDQPLTNQKVDLEGSSSVGNYSVMATSGPKFIIVLELSLLDAQPASIVLSISNMRPPGCRGTALFSNVSGEFEIPPPINWSNMG